MIFEASRGLCLLSVPTVSNTNTATLLIHSQSLNDLTHLVRPHTGTKVNPLNSSHTRFNNCSTHGNEFVVPNLLQQRQISLSELLICRSCLLLHCLRNNPA